MQQFATQYILAYNKKIELTCPLPLFFTPKLIRPKRKKQKNIPATQIASDGRGLS